MLHRANPRLRQQVRCRPRPPSDDDRNAAELVAVGAGGIGGNRIPSRCFLAVPIAPSPISTQPSINHHHGRILLMSNSTAAPAAQPASTPPARSGGDWLKSWNRGSGHLGLQARVAHLVGHHLHANPGVHRLVPGLGVGPNLRNLGFNISDGQLYWLIAMPSLAGGTLRLIWTFLPPSSVPANW